MKQIHPPESIQWRTWSQLLFSISITFPCQCQQSQSQCVLMSSMSSGRKGRSSHNNNKSKNQTRNRNTKYKGYPIQSSMYINSMIFFLHSFPFEMLRCCLEYSRLEYFTHQMVSISSFLVTQSALFSPLFCFLCVYFKLKSILSYKYKYKI